MTFLSAWIFISYSVISEPLKDLYEEDYKHKRWYIITYWRGKEKKYLFKDHDICG